MTDPLFGAAGIPDLPIREAIEPLRAALAARGRAVLHAPPGAGKTTVVPLVLLGEGWCDGTVLVLEPRRLAVRSAARRMADLLGERAGERVGWRMRLDTNVSRATRLEVVTEGVLTRRLQRDPELTGVSAVVFDEFHERSLDADLGLALTLDVAGSLRDDLRIVVMSATLDVDPIVRLLDAPVVRVEGRSFPVTIEHVDLPQGPDRRRAVEPAVVATVRKALAAHDGDVLVFLPGAAEIRRVEQALGDVGAGVRVRSLHGALPPDAQDAAIAPSPPGTRKVVLATSIAETSLTIEGVTVVVDAGLRRTPRLDPGTGMSRLVTLPVTVAEADQRAGRAGRLAPGTAYRLWSRADHATRRAHPEPEIEVVDLVPLALELAAWGAAEDELAWVTPPPDAHLAAARDLLRRLGALEPADPPRSLVGDRPDQARSRPADGEGAQDPRPVRVTAHGRAMAELPMHPRLAHLLLRGAKLGHGALAADLAAVLHEPGLSRRRRTDVADRLRTLRSPGDADRGAVARARADARRWRALVSAGGRPGDTAGTPAEDAAGLVLALGYPDRIARARPVRADGSGRGELLLANGRGAFVEPTDPLADAAWLVVAELDGHSTRSRVYEAAVLDEDDVRTVAGDAIVAETEVGWDPRSGDVVARTVERFGALVLAERPADSATPEQLRAALLDGLRQEGIGVLAWDDDTRRLQARLGFLHRLDPERWPDVGDEALLADADARIAPLLAGARRRRDLRRIDVTEVLLAGLTWHDRTAVDELAPERLPVPSGNRHRVDYTSDPPVLAVKLQELFGATETPAVGGGRVPVVLHLLSPAGRPLQVTQDLPSFWRGAYAQVRADMRGRYPKHPWPEDPTTAEPTSRTKRRT